MTTEQPLALKLADRLEAEVKRTVSMDILHNDAAIELQRLHQSEREGWRYADELEQERKRLHTQNEALRSAITKLHAAKGRYHTQLAVCDLFDLVRLPNERPKK
jgi:hypothetical protein